MGGNMYGSVGLKTRLIITGVFGGICASAALFSIIIVPIPGIPGGSGYWIPAALYFTLTLWFGIYGALAGHIGTFFGMGPFFGFTFQVWADGALGDFFAPILGWLIFKGVFRADPELKTRKDVVAWLVSVPPAVAIAAMWIHYVNYAFGTITFAAWVWGVIAYTIGDSLAVFTLGTIILKTASKWVKASPFYMKGLFR